jgi:mono/diheme cytochrome c family protein
VVGIAVAYSVTATQPLAPERLEIGRIGSATDGSLDFAASGCGSCHSYDGTDALDLIAYLRTLPSDATPSRAHDVDFPFNIGWSLGGWKFLFAGTGWVVQDVATPELERGRYLVEAIGHCAECHTPRNALGGLKRGEWMQGAANPSGEGRIPSLHPDDLGWSGGDIAYYLDTGFTPGFDTVGVQMVDVVENISQLDDADRDAIAAYLLALD